MERLTNRGNRDGISIQKMFDRLAAYEDTGLEPYEIEFYREAQDHTESMSPKRFIEIAQAEKDGRLVVLPCKVGDTVWTESPIKGMVYSFEAPDIAWIIESADQFGKTVFLTREEAEAAMKRG